MGIYGADCDAKTKWLENKIALTADTGDVMQRNGHNTVTGKHVFLILGWLFQKQPPATLLKKSLWHRCFPMNL